MMSSWVPFLITIHSLLGSTLACMRQQLRLYQVLRVRIQGHGDSWRLLGLHRLPPQAKPRDNDRPRQRASSCDLPWTTTLPGSTRARLQYCNAPAWPVETKTKLGFHFFHTRSPDLGGEKMNFPNKSRSIRKPKPPWPSKTLSCISEGGRLPWRLLPEEAACLSVNVFPMGH